MSFELKAEQLFGRFVVEEDADGNEQTVLVRPDFDADKLSLYVNGVVSKALNSFDQSDRAVIFEQAADPDADNPVLFLRIQLNENLVPVGAVFDFENRVLEVAPTAEE